MGSAPARPHAPCRLGVGNDATAGAQRIGEREGHGTVHDDRSNHPSIAGRGSGNRHRLPIKATGFAAGLLGAAAMESAAAEKAGRRRGRRDDEDSGGQDDGKGRNGQDERGKDSGGRGNDPERQQSAQRTSADKGAGEKGGDGDGPPHREGQAALQDALPEPRSDAVAGQPRGADDDSGESLVDRIRADLEGAADRRRSTAEDLADRLRPNAADDDASDDDDPVDIDLDIADDGDVNVDVALNVPGLDGPPEVNVNIPDLPGFDGEEGDPDGGGDFAFRS